MLNQELFKTRIRGSETGLHIFGNEKLSAAITNFGARIVALWVKDREGNITDVVAGFDSIQGYLDSTETYYGAIIGRYANRIAKGRFSIDSRDYFLSINNAPNHLHGGPMGFHNQVWNFEEVSNSSVRLTYLSPDGEENYPGNLKVSVTYQLTSENGILITYEAEADRKTVFNPTSHPFFNLNGQGKGSIAGHILHIEAGYYTPVDQNLIPVGIVSVKNSPFDFTKPTAIGERIDSDHEQLRYGHGYDHNMVLHGSGFRKVAGVQGDLSGIIMEVHTDQPGMQLYSGNYLKSENRIKYGQLDRCREAFCLETQHYPDSPNHPEFPTTFLEPQEKFYSRTEYRFL